MFTLRFRFSSGCPCAGRPADADSGDLHLRHRHVAGAQSGFQKFPVNAAEDGRRRKPGSRDDQKRVADYCWPAADPAGFFTDFLGLLLLLPPVQKHLTMKLLPHLRFSRMPCGGFSTGPGDTFEGEYQRKDEQRDRLDHKDDR